MSKKWENLPKSEQDKIIKQIDMQIYIDDVVDLQYEAYHRKIKPEELEEQILAEKYP